MRSLYSITADLVSINDLLEDIEGDLSRLGEMEPAVTAWLDNLGAEASAKLDGYVAWLRQLRMEAAAAREESERWRMKAKARDGRADYLMDRLRRFMQATAQPKIVTDTGNVLTVCVNGGAMPMEVDPLALEDYPREFKVWKEEVNKDAIRAALTEGREFPFARFAPRGAHVRIK